MIPAANASPPTTATSSRRDRGGSNASRNASIDSHRASGSGDSPRRTTRSSHTGTARPLAGVSIRPSAVASASECRFPPVNGGCPYSASNNATQNANWSLAAVAGFASCTSGAMYRGVPTIRPVRDSFVSHEDPPDVTAPSGVVCTPSSNPANPKSVTFGTPPSVTSTFAGLKSR